MRSINGIYTESTKEPNHKKKIVLNFIRFRSVPRDMHFEWRGARYTVSTEATAVRENFDYWTHTVHTHAYIEYSVSFRYM